MIGRRYWGGCNPDCPVHHILLTCWDFSPSKKIDLLSLGANYWVESLYLCCTKRRARDISWQTRNWTDMFDSQCRSSFNIRVPPRLKVLLFQEPLVISALCSWEASVEHDVDSFSKIKVFDLLSIGALRTVRDYTAAREHATSQYRYVETVV